jgi:hypothetical protein
VTDLARKKDALHATASVIAGVPPTFRATGTTAPPAGSNVRSVTRTGVAQHLITLDTPVFNVARATIQWGPRAIAPGFMLSFAFTSTTTITVQFTALPAEGNTEGDYDFTVLNP